jgi:hypothetical protein
VTHAVIDCFNLKAQFDIFQVGWCLKRSQKCTECNSYLFGACTLRCAAPTEILPTMNDDPSKHLNFYFPRCGHLFKLIRDPTNAEHTRPRARPVPSAIEVRAAFWFSCVGLAALPCSTFGLQKSVEKIWQLRSEGYRRALPCFAYKLPCTFSSLPLVY